MEKKLDYSAYLSYAGLHDVSLVPYIQEITQLLGEFGYKVTMPQDILTGKLYASSVEQNNDRQNINQTINNVDLVIEIARGSDSYEQRLKEPHTEIAISTARRAKKQVIILFLHYRCSESEFNTLKEEKKEALLKGVPPHAILVRDINSLLNEVRKHREKLCARLEKAQA